MKDNKHEQNGRGRPVAFRVPRVVDDKISKTEFRLFNDEDEARRAAHDIGADYDGLYLVADRCSPDEENRRWRQAMRDLRELLRA